MIFLSANTRMALVVGMLFLAGLVTVPPAKANIGTPAPEITNEIWLNSPPLRLAQLQGKVVLVEFWTFGCYNCRNIEPYVKAWHDKYAEQGLVVIAIHSPEFSYEESVTRVKDYLEEHDISYAVPIDNDFVTWKRFQNRYWPTLYLIDKQGTIQYMKIGEGGYAQTEKTIRRLLGAGPRLD